MHELHTSAFSALLPEPCETCPFPPVACESPFALGDEGKAVYPGGKDVIVEWPKCPRKWHVGRQWGGALLPLSMVCNYEIDRGLHRSDRLGSAGHRLLMEALRIRDVPRKLLEFKRFKERQDKGGK